MRVQLAINVDDLEKSINYYTKLFGVEAHKIRDGYANFAIDSPPLKLVLFENPAAEQRLHHLGVEVFEAEELVSARDRLSRAGIVEESRIGDTCCHATQDKIWSRDSQGVRWEWYRITDDTPTEPTQRSRCCIGQSSPDHF